LFALQDISPDMGPTIFFPSTQTKEPVYNAPVQHQGDDLRSSQHQLEGANNPFVLATLSCGDAAVYDSRTLHCGGGNSSDKIRVIFYCSFINAAGPLAHKKDFWNVTSILPEYVDKFCLDDFRAPK
jgi:ectoine hydroxylase-related dioxygenase (phytanoyl-CoA dioxygenase family)